MNSGKHTEDAMDEIARITVWIPDLEALKTVLATAQVELERGGRRQDEDGFFRVTLHGTVKEAKKIEALDYRYEIDTTYGKVLRERQGEVSKVDRFEGGTKRPEGLGVKQ